MSSKNDATLRLQMFIVAKMTLMTAFTSCCPLPASGQSGATDCSGVVPGASLHPSTLWEGGSPILATFNYH